MIEPNGSFQIDFLKERIERIGVIFSAIQFFHGKIVQLQGYCPSQRLVSIYHIMDMPCVIIQPLPRKRSELFRNGIQNINGVQVS